MEEWTGFELSEEVLEEAGYWIAVLDEIEAAELESVKNASTAFIDCEQLPAGAAMQAKSKQQIIESFNEWLSAHAQHQQAYAEMSLLWAKSACIHEISDRLNASNVFTLPKLSDFANNDNLINADESSSIDDFKHKHLPIIQPYPQNLQPSEQGNAQSSPSWAFALTIGLIVLGMASPFIYQFL